MTHEELLARAERVLDAIPDDAYASSVLLICERLVCARSAARFRRELAKQVSDKELANLREKQRARALAFRAAMGATD